MGLHARDLMGILLMMLVFTEATRKYMTMKDLASMQAEAERLTSMFELNQLASQLATRRLLAPPAVKTNDDSPRYLDLLSALREHKKGKGLGASASSSGKDVDLDDPFSNVEIKRKVCQSPGMDCLPGEEVRCEMGRHEGCDCKYIQACFPRASQCTFFNATHVRTCGF